MGKVHEAKAQREAGAFVPSAEQREEMAKHLLAAARGISVETAQQMWSGYVKSYRDELGRMAAAAFAYAAECMVRRAPAPQAAKVTVEVIANIINETVAHHSESQVYAAARKIAALGRGMSQP